MVKALEAARNAARKAQEALYYEDLCTIIEYRKVTDEETKLTCQREVVVIENQPCKLSFEKLGAVIQTATAAEISQGTKLFIAPEVVVKGGSKIIVTQKGAKTEYAKSGKAAIYPTHQEIMLELFTGWA